MSGESAVQFEHPRTLAVEDRARADFYALLANLFYRAPDERLLTAIIVAPEPEGEGSAALAGAWRDLATASRLIPPDAIEEEYQQIFVGVGKPPVMLYGSFYLAGFMMERPLADLRDDLAALGFARASNINEPEDHLAALCDVMRALICGDLGRRPATIAEQSAFFSRHIKTWVVQCCDATTKYAQSNYYVKVAAFARAFFEIEIAAFEMP
ncbi:MAG: molecular chaperone TorD family protein [Betaproteobacteria bacterium]|nr:molecular chaperone TorD family protein [Betaproteobacteria bacterium]